MAVDHGAQGLQERLTGAGRLERAERPGDRLQVGRLAPTEATESGADPVDRAEDAAMACHAHHRGRARQRGAAEQRAHLAAEPAARDQRQALDLVGELPEEDHRDPAAERVADEGRRLDLERGEQVADHRRVGAERVVAAGRGRVAMADQVGDDHGVGLGEAQGDLAPVLRRVDHPVDDHQRRPRAGGAVDHLVAVELDAPGGERVGIGRTQPLAAQCVKSSPQLADPSSMNAAFRP